MYIPKLSYGEWSTVGPTRSLLKNQICGDYLYVFFRKQQYFGSSIVHSVAFHFAGREVSHLECRKRETEGKDMSGKKDKAICREEGEKKPIKEI